MQVCYIVDKKNSLSKLETHVFLRNDAFSFLGMFALLVCVSEKPSTSNTDTNKLN